MTEKVLITGGAGFIGSHLAKRLVSAGTKVGILDNFDDFYSPSLKRQNIQGIAAELFVVDIRNPAELQKAADRGWDAIVHLAALAGVRPSINNPRAYIETNRLPRRWIKPSGLHACQRHHRRHHRRVGLQGRCLSGVQPWQRQDRHTLRAGFPP